MTRASGLTLVVFGLTISSSWGNGHATLWRALCRALGRSGHRVVFFERDTPYYAAHRDRGGDDIEGCVLHLYRSWDDVAADAARAVSSADAAMVTSYCPDAERAADLVLDAGAAGARVRAFYDLDTPVTLSRLAAGDTVEYLPRRGLSGFDVVLSYGGGAALDRLEAELGARLAVPLYGSADPEAHAPAPARASLRSDLSYLGTYAADREAKLDALFFEAARRLPERRFVLGGSMYPSAASRPTNVAHLAHVPPADHPAFFSSSSLTLNVTRAAMAELGFCPSGRLFEAAACGAPIVTDAWGGLDRFFAPDEVLVAETTDDVVAALARDPRDLAAMARRARERTLDEHTAASRAGELVSILERCRGPCAATDGGAARRRARAGDGARP